MTEKVISGSDKSCTVTVSGEVTRVRFEGSYLYIQVRHLSGEIICGRRSDIADGANGTAKLASGGICFDVASPVIYIGGDGVCEVYATNSETLVFKNAPASGGGDEHMHSNLDVLDKLSENSGGELMFDGAKVGGGSGLTLIGRIAVTQGQWASIGILEAGTRLLIEQATITAVASSTASSCTLHGYTLIPQFSKTQVLYFAMVMPSPSGIRQLTMALQSNGNVQITGNSTTGAVGAFNVYRVEATE